MGDTRMETYYGFVSTSEDALALFEACRLGYKQRVPRRLSDAERAAIRSGSVFVWEEGESGMKRWTDGRSWSPSRVQGCFLTYHEWEGRRRAQRHPSTYQHQHPGHHSMQPQGAYSLPISVHGLPPNHHHHQPMGIARYGHFIGGPTKAGSTQVQYGMPKENGMLKKALSIRTNNGKKLHIIAYYSKDDHVKRRLLTPTSDPNFPRLDVPPNLYPDMSPESMYGAGHSSMCYNSANDIDSDYVARTTPDHHTHHQLENQQPQQPPPPQRRPHNLSIHRAPPSLPSSASPTSSSSAVDDMSAAFHKARVQSLVTPGDVPPASAFTNTSRPAPEHGYRGEPLLLQPLSAPSGSTACIQGAASRPSSNSFSFGGPTTSSSSTAMASYSSAPSSSASAPASSVMRSAVATSSSSGAAGHATAPDDNSAPSSAYMAGANSGTGGYRSRYSGLGLGGGGGGGGASSSNGSSSAAVAGHRATPLRSVTTAAVMMHHHNASDHPTSRLPLLLSPISATHLTQGINLAGIRRDVKEGPRRLPSISASLRGTCRDSGSPTDSVATTTTYSPGGLGIFTPSSILSANIPPLPSPLATPRQSSMALGFEGDSLSLLALAADRAQVRSGGTNPQSRIASVSGHHPYSRPWKRGPSMRSVSLKQSEDVRQLGALDQGLRLK